MLADTEVEVAAALFSEVNESKSLRLVSVDGARSAAPPIKVWQACSNSV
jgi:hypothetical protein